MIWKSVKGYSNYEISEFGDIRKLNGKIISQCNSHGYKYVTLFGAGGRRGYRVHRLVAIAFLPPPASSAMDLVAHNDGSKDNNHYSNLRWDTCKGNLADRKKHGTTLDGVRNGRAKLSAEQVQEIRLRYTPGHSQNSAAALGREFGVSDVAIIKAFRGENWASTLPSLSEKP